MRLNLGLGPSSAFRWPALPLGGAEPRAVYHIQKCAHARCVFTMCWSCSINLACMYQIIARTEAFSTWHSGSRYSIHLCLGSTSFAYNGCMQKKGIYIYIYTYEYKLNLAGNKSVLLIWSTIPWSSMLAFWTLGFTMFHLKILNISRDSCRLCVATFSQVSQAWDPFQHPQAGRVLYGQCAMCHM